MQTLCILEKNNRASVKKAIAIAWPAVLETFFIALVGMVDSLMVSTVGPEAVAAVGLTAQPKYVALSLFFATNVAVSALVARRKGEQNRRGANQVLVMSAIFSLLAACVISIGCILFADEIMRFSGSQADTHEMAVSYFQIITGCMMFTVISMFINATQRGTGNTKIAMRTNITSNIVNVIGNYLLIGGNFGFPKLGVQGAAIATVIGTAVACIMSVGSICKKDSYMNLSFILKEKIKPSIQPAFGMFKIGSTVFLEQILVRVGFMSVAVMAANLGTDTFAAHQVGMNVMGLSFSFGDGMQVAAVALIGQSLGENKPELAKLYGKICRQIGMVIAVLLSIIYLIFGEWLFRQFFSEESIVATGLVIMKVIVLIVLLQIGQVIYMGCLRGAGDVVFTTAASTLSVTIVRPLASYILCYLLGFGIVGIWLGIVADQITRFTLTAWRFRSGKWLNFKI